MEDVTVHIRDKSHIGNKLLLVPALEMVSETTKETKPGGRGQLVPQGDHANAAENLHDLQSRQQSLNWSQFTAVFIHHFTSEKLKMFRELQMGKIDERDPRNSELCASNAVPNLSKEQRLIGIRNTTIS